MFGYVIINKPELKFKEFDVYRSYYCGLCKALKKSGGNMARMSLSYDMTFVYLLLTGLYEPETRLCTGKCVFHPINKPMVSTNKFAGYVADMSVIMTYYKCKDDWKDERKFTAGFLIGMLSKKHKCIVKKYPEKIKIIAELMEKLDEGERENSTAIDKMSGYFGKIMGELFVYEKDDWEPILKKTGFYLGKFIYLIDAYEDIEEDKKKNNYNPLRDMYNQDNFEEKAAQILLMMMSACAGEFEKLPIIENGELLRNILYSGVWVRYEKVRKSRCAKDSGTEARKDNDRSI